MPVRQSFAQTFVDFSSLLVRRPRGLFSTISNCRCSTECTRNLTHGEFNMMARIFLGCALLVPLACEASTSQAAVPFQFEFNNGGQVLFRTSGSRSTLPACATVPNRWAIDASTAGGKAMLAGALSALAQGKAVTVVGKGVCDVWGDTETVDYFYFT